MVVSLRFLIRRNICFYKIKTPEIQSISNYNNKNQFYPISKNNIPKLRFNKFENNWNVYIFKDILDIISGYGFKMNEYSSNGVPLIKINNIGYGNILIDDMDYLPEDYLEKYPNLVLNKNDILLALNRPITNNKLKIALLKNEDVPSILYQRVGKIILKNDNLYYLFIYYLLQEKIFKFILKNSKGSDQPFISTNELKKIELKIPSLKEQKKIGNFLSIMDKKLFLMEKKHSLYVDIKKYFIKNIFHDINEESTDNCLIDNVKWKQLKLKDIIKKGKAGGTPKSSVKKYYNGNIPFLSINDMTKEGKYITYTEKTMSKLGLENSSAWIVPEKSLLYSIYASVGFVSINNIPLATSQAIFSIIFKDDIDLEFMYYHLTFYKKYIHKYIETGTQQNLKAETIKNFKIKIPPLEKQEKISKFLSSIDKYIQIHEQDLNNLKKYKKGLLQKMFI